MSKHYLIQAFGDLPRTDGGKSINNTIKHTLKTALSHIEKHIVSTHVCREGYCWHEMGSIKWDTDFDCEDDRVLVWEVLEEGHKKVVWHASGWHWDVDEFGLDQGKLPEMEHSLYHISTMDL